MRKSRRVLATVIKQHSLADASLWASRYRTVSSERKRTPSIREFFFCFILDNMLLVRKENHYELKRTIGTP